MVTHSSVAMMESAQTLIAMPIVMMRESSNDMHGSSIELTPSASASTFAQTTPDFGQSSALGKLPSFGQSSFDQQLESPFGGHTLSVSQHLANHHSDNPHPHMGLPLHQPRCSLNLGSLNVVLYLGLSRAPPSDRHSQSTLRTARLLREFCLILLLMPFIELSGCIDSYSRTTAAEIVRIDATDERDKALDGLGYAITRSDLFLHLSFGLRTIPPAILDSNPQQFLHLVQFAPRALQISH